MKEGEYRQPLGNPEEYDRVSLDNKSKMSYRAKKNNKKMPLKAENVGTEPHRSVKDAYEIIVHRGSPAR